ncbi:uncharacterized protein LOC129594345 [Paramacrobiotus metropolitanus]|uniref:uncharacterized protein LOC129594345 n=1 Tax=Paramacrobiotus metropolitanus TaxID=2943436 RepID=UPI0024464491|nr:uncharacterized protein LOC129594345 [Paramacrobiotus metropolitanus]
MMYFFVMALGLAVLQLTSCCPAQHELTVNKMNQILNEAKERNGNGTMWLQGHGRGPSTRGFPIAEWPPQTEIIRAPEGGTLFIPCKTATTPTARLCLTSRFRRHSHTTEGGFLFPRKGYPESRSKK